MTDTVSNGSRKLNDRQRMNLNSLALQADLRERLKGEVRFDAGTRAIYAHDSSNYRQVPFGVVIPKDEDDVMAAIEVCHKHGAPVLPRGTGTSLSGETTNVVLYDGTRMTVGQTSDEEFEQIIGEGGRKGEIYQKLKDLRDRYADMVRERYPDIPRRVSGYNLDDLLPENGFNVARALVGSEGTLAVILRAKVRLVHSPPFRSLVVLGYPSAYEAGDHVSQILEYGPIGLEGIDTNLIRDMQEQGMHQSDLQLIPEGQGWLLVEFGGETDQESHDNAQKLIDALKDADNAPDIKLFDEIDEAERIWGIRESGLGATAYIPGEGDHWPGWEDSAVPPDRVGNYLRDLRELFNKYNYDAALYGHFGDGCIHCRINFDLKTAEGLKNWHDFMSEAADLVVSYNGSLSGEHGDGQQRAEFLPKMYGEDLMQAFRDFKEIWDPDWKMNPGKIIDANPMLSDLRLGADYNPQNPDKLYFSYPQNNGSFAHATMRCVGVGLCRDTSSGTMCPSYMVTLDEKHTTRGRARILHEMIRGEGPIKDGFKSKEVFDSLDLCLSCKGCKGDCPVDVDMATYKAEFLSKHYKGRLRPRYAYTMGLIMLHARIAQYVPRLANLVTHTPVLKDLVQKAGGISTEREMPPFATQTFKAWFEERGPMNPDGPPVVLFPDTFNN
ncbi:MAG: FAD-binding protein, partial [Actinobacteria bacterium]|nr:FAD-binding protein [Actinomycetota bacterium]